MSSETQDTIRRNILRLIHEHNLSVSPQGLRHTFVSFGKKKIPEGMLQQYCGHSEDMDTFGVYGHELEDDMDETVKYLDDIFSFLDDEKLA